MKSFFSSPPLRTSVGADVVPLIVPGFDPNALAKELQRAASLDTEKRAKQTATTEASVRAWGKKLAEYTAGQSILLAEATVYAIEALAVVSNLISGDPNSQEWQDRATNAYGAALGRGWMPHDFDADLYFAKDYALYLEAGNAQFDAFLGDYSITSFYGGLPYRKAWEKAMASQVVVSAAALSKGFWDSAYACGPQGTAVSSTYQRLPMFLAAVGSVGLGIDLPSAISIAYGAMGALKPDGSSCNAWNYHKEAWKALVAKAPSVAAGGGGSSSTVGTVATVAAVGGGGYLAVKFLWPAIKGYFGRFGQ